MLLNIDRYRVKIFSRGEGEKNCIAETATMQRRTTTLDRWNLFHRS